MARSKIISDEAVLSKVLEILWAEGEKSVTFGAVSGATGLAPSTLVQRYGSCSAMVTLAVAHGWDRLDALLDAVSVDPAISGKGVQGLLKSLSGPLDSAALLALSLRDKAMEERAKAWRNHVEEALATRLGGGTKAKDSAAVIFAAWQGRMLWDKAGGKGFRLGEALKRLA